MFDVLDLSWFIVRRCFNNGTPISHLQLQLILLRLQTLSVEEDGVLLFKDNFENKVMGKIVPKVYFQFNIYSSTDIVPMSIDPNPHIPLKSCLLEEIDKIAQMKPWSEDYRALERMRWEE